MNIKRCEWVSTGIDKVDSTEKYIPTCNAGTGDFVKQSVMTTEEPFKVYKDGIFFRAENGFGLQITKFGNDMATVISMKDCLNRAYQLGFSDGTLSMSKIQ